MSKAACGSVPIRIMYHYKPTFTRRQFLKTSTALLVGRFLSRLLTLSELISPSVSAHKEDNYQLYLPFIQRNIPDLQVGPSRTYKVPSEAASVAKDGDIIEIDAGDYLGDTATWKQNNLTLRGVGEKAHLIANGQSAGGKAIWVIQGNNTTLENIEFSGATVPDQNGAGIRQEGNNLTLQDDFAAPNIHAPLTGNNYTIDGIQPCRW